MKVVGMYVIHYGIEWLEWSIRSIRDYVDDIIVMYSPRPSFGHDTNVKCPETYEQIYRIVYSQGVKFHTGVYYSEAQHREAAMRWCSDANLVLVVDADELWKPVMLGACLDYVSQNPIARRWTVPMQHYYRSVGWVCHDPARPTRIIDNRVKNEITEHLPDSWGNVLHFGYAQSKRIVQYKWLIHGHLPELRPGWYEEKFVGWQPGMLDVHPTNVNFWNPVYEDRAHLKSLLNDHPYYHMDIIE